ncbi:MAG TPA: iron-containing alcohol dehydrogenase [Spirochaetota bacterium]|nr:iron-containing alcohol dehydrogenase [Spirochaetota bacterium]
MERYNPFEIRNFILPEILFGSGAMEMVDKCVKEHGAAKILVVTDPGVLKAGWAEVADRLVKNTGIKFVLYSGVTSNPKNTEVAEGALLFGKEKCSLILAVGGGSVIDCAKGIAASYSGSVKINEFEGDDLVPLQPPPVICIPTTAGTSSDLSQYAMITRTDQDRKFALKSRKIMPRITLIDSITTTTLPPELTAYSGMAALANAFEAYTSAMSSPLTDMYALKAVNLLFHNLVPAIEHHYDLRYRDRMMYASLLAGMAYSATGPGLYHAAANSLSGITGLNHGECCAVLLEYISRADFYSSSERYSDLARATGVDTEGMGHDRIRDALVNEIDSLRLRSGISFSLRERGVTADKSGELAAQATGSLLLKNCGREVPAAAVEKIFTKAI